MKKKIIKLPYEKFQNDDALNICFRMMDKYEAYYRFFKKKNKKLTKENEAFLQAIKYMIEDTTWNWYNAKFWNPGNFYKFRKRHLYENISEEFIEKLQWRLKKKDKELPF